MDSAPIKQCSKCGMNPRHGKSSWCAECRKIYARERYARTREQVIERVKQWSKDNPERRAAIAAKSYRKNVDKRAAYHQEFHAARRAEDPHYYQHRNLRLRFGLTPDEHKVMMDSQEGKCAICDTQKELVVDHNHDDGRVRALLCQRCNKGIGHFKDDIDLMRSAIEYLEHYRTCEMHPKNRKD